MLSPNSQLWGALQCHVPMIAVFAGCECRFGPFMGGRTVPKARAGGARACC